MNTSETKILESFEALADKISVSPHAKNKEIDLYLRGVSSLYMHGISDNAGEPEWLIPDAELSTSNIRSVGAGGEFILLGESQASQPHILNITHKSHLAAESKKHPGTRMRCISPSIIFLSRLESSDEHDFLLREKISNFISPMDIIDAINDSAHLNTDDANLNIGRLALSEIACLYFWGAGSIIQDIEALADALKFSDDVMDKIRYSFGLWLPSQSTEMETRSEKNAEQKRAQFESA